MSELDVLKIMRDVRERARDRHAKRDAGFGGNDDGSALAELCDRAREGQTAVGALREHASQNLKSNYDEGAARAQECRDNDAFPSEEAQHAPGLSAKARRVIRRIKRRLSSQPDRLAHNIVERLDYLTTNADFVDFLGRQGDLNNAVVWSLERLIEWEASLGDQIIELLESDYASLNDFETLAAHLREEALRREQTANTETAHLRLEIKNSAEATSNELKRMLLEKWNHTFPRDEATAALARLEALEKGSISPEAASALFDQRLAAVRRDLFEQYERLLAPVDAATLREPTVQDAGSQAIDFFAFEAQTRGDEAEIRDRQKWHVERFVDCGNVLDAGCGRGEFLTLCRDAGIDAYGVDSDARMAHHCMGLGLRAHHEDLFVHLRALPDGSLGGVFAGQVIEHLNVSQQVEFSRLAFQKIRPGGRLVMETINPSCLTVFSGAFYADPTHVKPVHPAAMRFFFEEAGFVDCDQYYLNPVPDEAKLENVPVDDDTPDSLRRTIGVLNANFAKLNSVLHTHSDYAIAATRPDTTEASDE